MNEIKSKLTKAFKKELDKYSKKELKNVKK